jgi:hypothetical protein
LRFLCDQWCVFIVKEGGKCQSLFFSVMER